MELRIDSATDQVILAALVERDGRRAARLMVNYYGLAVFEECCRRVGRRELAEDLTQVAFARAFAALAEFGGRRSAREWLVAVAHECCAEYLRAHPEAGGSTGIEGEERAAIGESIRRRLEVLAAAV